MNKLDQAAKEHDLAYNNSKITTEEADEKFLKDTKGTGLVGGLARAAIRAKRALGLDDYFRGDIDNNNTDSVCNIQDMEIGDSGAQAASDGSDGNRWNATVIGKRLLPASSNYIQQHCFNRRFKNMIKTTDMNSINGTFPKYQGQTTATGNIEPINSIGHYVWAQPESADYDIPYFHTMWVTPPK